MTDIGINHIRNFFSGLACLVLAGCMTTPPISPNRALIESYTQAFNDQNVSAMAAMMHPDIQWISVSGSTSAVNTDGKAKMVEEMTAYFSGSTSVTSTISGWGVNGAFVSAVETASWTAGSGKKQAQRSNVVYQVDDDLVRRVWYFPEQSAP